MRAVGYVNKVKDSFEPDSNQRPKDINYASTVLRSTNWAIEGTLMLQCSLSRERSLESAVKDIFVIRDWSIIEIASFFLVIRDFIGNREPWFSEIILREMITLLCDSALFVFLFRI